MNSGFDYREQVGRPGHGRSVLDYLSRRYRHSDEGAWRERIQRGEVLLDGAPATCAALLRAGQSLVWRRPPWEEEPVPLAFAVLHRDDHLLAVAKPRALPTIPNGGGFLTHTLLHLVRGREPDASPLHRLGRGTSGLVLFGLTAEARAAVSAAWRTPAVRKVYRALVRGVPAREAFTVDVPIGPVPHPRLGRVHAACADGRPSLSHVTVLAARGGDAVVDVAIDTGRPLDLWCAPPPELRV